MTLPPSLRLKEKSTLPIEKREAKQPSSLRPKQKKIEEKEYNERSFKERAQEYASSPSTQVGLGLTQALTSPLDLIKMYITGEALQGLDEAEDLAFKEGRPFDREKEQQKVLSSLEYLPTQSLAENILEKETGISTEPKDRFSKVLRGISEFAGLTKGAKPASKVLGVEEKALKETGVQFDLKKFAGMEKEKTPNITPVVSAKKQEKLTKELGESSKKAIDEIVKEKIPVKKLQEMGTNLEDAYTAAYSSARETAAKVGDKNIDFSNVVEWANQEIKKTKGSSPSLSKQDRIYIDILNSEKKDLLQSPRKKIDLITGKEIPVKPKEVKANQAIKQYQNYNDNVKGIYRKPEFSGSENTVKNAYAGLNEQILKSIEKASPELGKDLGYANKLFHETSKLNQVDNILSKAFKDGYDPNKLARTLFNRRERAFLQRNLGKDAIQDFEKIAKYGQKAEEKIFNNLKNPETVKEYLNNITPAKLALLVGFKSHIGVPWYLAKGAINRMQGYLLTREPTRHAYENFMKEAAQLGKSPAPLFMAAKKLEEAISKEYGSEDNLLKMSTTNIEEGE